MINAPRLVTLIGASILSLFVGCGSDSPVTNKASGGKPGAGGAAGGATTNGGSPSSGGKTASSGGAVTSGGQTSMGGSSTAGGSPTSGGAVKGGSSSAGGSSAAGGSSGTGSTGDCPMELYGWATEGNGTTGGGNATPKVVTSSEELKQLAAGTDPQVIHLSGSFSAFAIGSNKTIIGKGAGTKVAGGITIKGSNIILRNLTVKGGKDTIAATYSDHMWFDHLDLSDGADGILDLTRESDFATVSWTKIYYDRTGEHRLALLFGNGSTFFADKGHNNHTVHHNWFGKGVKSRGPRLLFGKGHMYNNFYNSPDNNYCIGSGSWASLLVENNYFKDLRNPHEHNDTNPSYITATGNIYDNAVGNQHTGPGGKGSDMPGPWTPTYKYPLDDAKIVPELVQRCAGPQASLLN